MRLFKGVDLVAISSLLARSPVRQVEPGTCLISPGDTADWMYLVLDGRLRVHLATLDSDPVAVLATGESVGELSLLDASPRSAFVVADVATRVAAIDREVFQSLLNSFHAVALNLIGQLADRLRGNNQAVSESQRLQNEYKRHATIDGLTGLFNRRWLNEVLPRQVRRSEIQGEPLSLIMVDVDHFKRFNDTWGHQAGDFVLFVVAHTLRQRFRPTDLVARYGGEEFLVVLPDTRERSAVHAANRVREAVKTAPLKMNEIELPSVTVSLGVAERSAGQTLDELIGAADQALYRAKRGGRDRVAT